MCKWGRRSIRLRSSFASSPRIKIFRKFLSHPNKICPTPKFSEKDETIRAKASLASQTTFSSSSTAIGKGRKGSLDNKTNYIRTD